MICCGYSGSDREAIPPITNALHNFTNGTAQFCESSIGRILTESLGAARGDGFRSALRFDKRCGNPTASKARPAAARVDNNFRVGENSSRTSSLIARTAVCGPEPFRVHRLFVFLLPKTECGPLRRAVSSESGGAIQTERKVVGDGRRLIQSKQSG